MSVLPNQPARGRVAEPLIVVRIHYGEPSFRFNSFQDGGMPGEFANAFPTGLGCELRRFTGEKVIYRREGDNRTQAFEKPAQAVAVFRA